MIKNYLKKHISIENRKKIKSILESIKGFWQTTKIDHKSREEWSKPNSTNIDIIHFSVISWSYRFQRPQHLSKLLSNDHRIFYVETELTPGRIKKNTPFICKYISPNIFKINLAATRELFIYSEALSSKDKAILISSIKNLIKNAKIKNPVAIIDHPFWASIVNELSMPIIYDCMDSHQNFSDSSKDVFNLEKTLFTNTNQTIVTSKYLQNYAKKYTASPISLIPNAGDFNHFSQLNKLTLPADLINIKTPIIGYYGAISEWFDTKILEDIAIKHNDKSIVLIGLVSNNKVLELSSKYSNIYLLGEKTYDSLPSYLKYFDVCIIPFILSDLIKATHPVKIFEYLAAGKPVVLTKLPEILNLNYLYFSTQSNFSANIQIALNEKNKFIKQRQEIAKKNTWLTRANDYKKIIQQFFPKVSIIILSYHHPDLIKQTLDSIFNNSFYPNIEVIVVDNNSDQSTVKLLKTYKNIKLILNKTNYGFAKGNNIGLEIATGDYLIVLNNDVVVTPGWISRLLYHVQKPGVGLVGPVTNSIGNEAKIDYDLTNYSEYTSSHWGETLEVKNIAAFCWIMSKNTYQTIGNFDEIFGKGMFEDDDYCKRVITNHQKILIADDVFIYHFGGASFKQIPSPEYQKLFKDNKEKFEKKWHTKWIPHHYR
ncbi:MAG TPA: glycosyltransferase [Candidatus Woesebacteria bacterium]|nr:glycosyltransferase [Candidatus Woesebacteria bacterium]